MILIHYAHNFHKQKHVTIVTTLFTQNKHEDFLSGTNTVTVTYTVIQLATDLIS